MIDWSQIIGFDWDSNNSCKNSDKHGVSPPEAEEIFFNHPLLVLFDYKHSLNEQRYHALGKTNNKRQLHITFTLRIRKIGTLIRVISARDMHRKERLLYEQIKTNT